MKFRLMLCCNDYRNGAHTGQTDEVDICLEPILNLEGPPVSCNADGRELELDGLHFPVKGYREWAGNWCWVCVALEGVHVTLIINHLRKVG